jgi:nitronate monooxygenase
MVREPVALIRSEVAALRGRGMERFGVNLIPAATDAALLEAQISTCLELLVRVMGLFWDMPITPVQRLRDAGIVIVCQVGSLPEAHAVEHAGAQVVIAQYIEAGVRPWVIGVTSPIAALPRSGWLPQPSWARGVANTRKNRSR